MTSEAVIYIVCWFVSLIIFNRVYSSTVKKLREEVKHYILMVESVEKDRERLREKYEEQLRFSEQLSIDLKYELEKDRFFEENKWHNNGVDFHEIVSKQTVYPIGISKSLAMGIHTRKRLCMQLAEKILEEKLYTVVELQVPASNLREREIFMKILIKKPVEK